MVSAGRGINRRMVLGVGAVGLVGAGGYLGVRRLTRRRPDFADIAYGDGARQVLDIYLPAGDGPFPFVIDIHGGAFRMGSKAMSAPPEQLLSAGIAVVRPNYRLSDTDVWPAQGDDCLAATLFAVEHAVDHRLDPERFAVWGQSAGAFLAVSTALTLLAQDVVPRAVVSFYGPMDFGMMDADMASLGRTAAMGDANPADSAESLLLGFAVGSDPAAATAMGPVGRLDAMAPRPLPPLYVRHGDADPLIAHVQSERLAAAWSRVDPSAPVDMALIAGGGHGGGDFDGDAVLLPLAQYLSDRLNA